MLSGSTDWMPRGSTSDGVIDHIIDLLWRLLLEESSPDSPIGSVSTFDFLWAQMF